MAETQGTKVAPRLPSMPIMSDIHQLLSQAMEERGKMFEIRWANDDSTSDYFLTVRCNLKGGDAEWNMYSGVGTRRSLMWNYSSCDVLLVYNLVQSSCGGGFDEVTVVKESYVGKTWRQSGRAEQTLYQMEALIPASERLLAEENTKSDAAQAQKLNRIGSALTGDLAHIQTPTLLQSILMAKMSGRLKTKSNKQEAEVFFDSGIPVHASVGNITGEEAIYELLAWRNGDFHFQPDMKTEQRTIKQNLDAILVQGMQLIDNATYLRNAGLRPEALIKMRHGSLSEKDFEAMVSSGAPLPMAAQKSFYAAIESARNVQQLIEKVQLPRSQWIPLLCNMLRCELVTITHPSQKSERKMTLEPKNIDKRAIAQVMMSLRRPETGMFTYPAFLYFLEQEYFRGYRSASPISVVIFHMWSRTANAIREPLPIAAVSEAVRRISKVKRHVDMIAHYESLEYAMLLPNTKVAGAAVFCNRATKALKASPLIAGMDPDDLSLSFGIASIPEDTQDLSLLLSAAEVAVNVAQHGQNPIILYKDLK